MVTVIEFAPSTTAASAPVATKVAPLATKVPVEQRPGALPPAVLYVPPVTLIVPPPRSVTTAALLAPAVDTSRFVAVIAPPPLAMIPCAN